MARKKKPDPIDDIGHRFEVRWAEEHSRSNPADLDALRMLAYAYSGAGRHEDALEVDRRLVAAEPDRTDLHYDLACSLALTGRKDEAFEALAKVIALGWTEWDLMDGDDDLASLRDDPRWKRLRAKAKGS